MKLLFPILVFMGVNGVCFGQKALNDSSALAPTVSSLLTLPALDMAEEATTIAGLQRSLIRESPGIVTVITASEINHSGARDLMELLRQVPGLDFAHNFDGVVSLGVRGNWAAEGNVLMIIDGNFIPETAYGTIAFGQHYFLDNIEKIEIMRGPGSALYGGMAEYAVINIITKNSGTTNTGHISINGAANGQALTRSTLQTRLHHKFLNGVDMSVSGHIHSGLRSTFTSKYPSGDAVNYADSSRILSQHLNLNLRYQDWQTSLIYDYYQLRVTEAESSGSNAQMYMQNFFFNTQYSHKFGEKIRLSSTLNLRSHHPWNYHNGKPNLAEYAVRSHKAQAQVVLGYELSDKVLFSSGVQYFAERVSYLVSGYQFYTGKAYMDFSNLGVFSELDIRTRFASITLGGRGDFHSVVRPAIVPRIAITKAFDRYHFKGLYSTAFKAPTNQNINTNGDGSIKPEIVTVAEFEVGYKYQNRFFISANLFDIKINNPIVFVYDFEQDVESYVNGKTSGSRGVEGELAFKGKRLQLRANYSYYQAQYNQTEVYRIENDNMTKAAFPRHKIAGNFNFNLSKKISFGSSCVFTTPRKSYLYFERGNPDSELILSQTQSFLNLSTFITLRDVFTENLTIMLGGYNLLNQKSYLYPAVNIGLNAVPDQPFELNLKLTYQLGN